MYILTIVVGNVVLIKHGHAKDCQTIDWNGITLFMGAILTTKFLQKFPDNKNVSNNQTPE